ncbi:MAG: tripartite tricarboxylate transporter TctB family protein [Planctomycetota bacterium]|nr:tripartite tricarboxylate transporter TctB family protein [Planctomycetota bacterium]
MFLFDFVASGLVVALALSVILYSRTLANIETYSSGFGPGYWPSFLGCILLILGIILLLETTVKFLQARRTAAGQTAERPPPPLDFTSAGMRRVYFLCGILGVFVLILLKSGFLTGTVFLVPACMRLLEEKRWHVLAVMTVSVPIAVYIIFVRLLGVHLP